MDRGKGIFSLTPGPVEVTKEAVEADIENQVLLGLDALAGGNGEQADIFLSKNVIRLKGKEIPLVKEGKLLRKVTVAEDVTVPALSEALLDVYVERQEADDNDQESNYVIEIAKGFSHTYPLIMAATLVNINRAVTCKVRVLNPFSSNITLRHDAEIGEAEKIEKRTGVIAAEENIEEGNLATVRRVQLNNVCAHSCSTVLPVTNEHDVQPHLKTLFEQSTVNKTEEEKRVVAGILVKFADTFSKDEWTSG
ncbi:hypothetical protein DPMN_165097 [Dreissena polymorpha]|uniref:Uncharacterized protein n=1 Tax=Dreissena polymorpha TaxID=45954 RepID=A0A9D4IWP2_DREPO|nr:hypothetical protein DPMN_165097 [Dreissena polymorpha]